MTEINISLLGTALPSRLRQDIVAKTSAYPLVDADQGKLFTNEGATGIVQLTLPTAAAGKRFFFAVQDVDGLRVVAAAGDTIRLAGAVSAVAGYAQSTSIGSVLELVALNATEWFAAKFEGSWTVV